MYFLETFVHGCGMCDGCCEGYAMSMLQVGMGILQAVMGVRCLLYPTIIIHYEL